MQEKAAAQNKRVSLLTKFVTLFLLFALVMCVLITTFSYFNYRSSMLKLYGKYATGAASAVAAELSAEMVTRYAESLVPDAAYYAIHQKLMGMQKAMEVEFLYVQMPLSPDSLMFIFDAFELEAGEAPALGLIADYGDAEFNLAKEAMATGHPTAELDITKSEYGYLASAYAPIKDAAGTPIAYVGADINMDEIVASMRMYLVVVVVFAVTLVVACFALLLLLVRRAVLQPVAIIANRTEGFVSGIEDENYEHLQARSNDEIGTLAVAVNRMFDEIRGYTRRLAEETASKQRIEDDLKTARNIQTSLLPRLFPPYLAYTDVEIVASILPGEHMSGVFHDCFPVDKHHFAFVMADVDDNSVAAALFMMVVHTLVKNRAVSGYTPREVFESMNRQLCENNEQGMAAAAFLGIYDSRNNVLSYVNAGHPMPILKRTSGETLWLSAGQGQKLGLSAGNEYTTQVEQMGTGDCLLMYTQSLVDAHNGQGARFSRETLKQLVNKINLDVLAPQQVIETVESAVLSFIGGAARENDITLMMMRRL